MYAKIALNTILIIILLAFQLAFISGLPGWLNNINLILIISIFILSLSSLKLAFGWMIGVGFLLDIFSFSLFGVFLISLSLTLAILNFLLSNFFTNRSLYSFLALTFFSTLFYAFIFNLIIYFAQVISSEAVFFILNIKFWSNLMAQIILNLLAVLFIFYFIDFFSKRLKPAFLVKNKI